MKYARIVGGFVVDVTPERPVVGAHESAMILPCPDAAAVGWVLRAGEVVAPPAPDPRLAIMEELAALDVFVPRSVEEIYAAGTTKGLAPINVDRIARKVALRAQLAAL